MPSCNRPLAEPVFPKMHGITAPIYIKSIPHKQYYFCWKLFNFVSTFWPGRQVLIHSCHCFVCFYYLRYRYHQDYPEYLIWWPVTRLWFASGEKKSHCRVPLLVQWRTKIVCLVYPLEQCMFLRHMGALWWPGHGLQTSHPWRPLHNHWASGRYHYEKANPAITEKPTGWRLL